MINEASANIAKFMHMYEEIKRYWWGRHLSIIICTETIALHVFLEQERLKKLSKAFQESYKTSTEDKNCQ